MGRGAIIVFVVISPAADSNADSTASTSLSSTIVFVVSVAAVSVSTAPSVSGRLIALVVKLVVAVAFGLGEGCMRVGFISRMGAGSLCKAGIVDAVATWEKEPQGFGLLADVMAGVIPR